MILTTLADADRYAALHPRFAAAFTFLREQPLAELEPGRHTLDGDRLYANVDLGEGRGRDGAVLESHRRYIDIQYLVSGRETIGWQALSDCEQPRAAYDAERDLLLFDDAVSVWNELPPDHLMIFWPEDVHAPLAAAGSQRKVVVKVAMAD